MRLAIRRYREQLLVLLGGVLSLSVHAVFRIPGFGELDQARFGGDIVLWHLRGSAAVDDFSYRLRTSSLFMSWLKLLLDHGLAIRSLTVVMSWFVIVMSSVCSMALYYLFRAVCDARIAAAASVLYALTPGFWLCSLYGFPTVPAEAFLVCAALAFARACERPLASRAAAGWLTLCLLLCWLAFTHKADVALCSGVLLLVPLTRQLEAASGKLRAALRTTLLAGAVVGLATLGTLLFTRSLTPHTPARAGSELSSVQFAARWHEQWPWSFEHVLEPANNSPITHAIGTLWFAIAVFALLRGLIGDRAQRVRVLLVLAWALPSILFWSLVLGNSARHNVPAMPALMWCATLVIFEVARDWRRAYALCALVFAFSFLDRSGGEEMIPRFNFIQASLELEQAARERDGLARSFLRKPTTRRALIDSQYHVPYGEFQAFAVARNPSFSADPPTVHDASGSQTRLVEVPIGDAEQAQRAATQLRKSGWAVCSLYFGFCD